MLIKTILCHPLTVLVSIVFGILFGCFLPDYGRMMGDWGDLYLHSLQMCIMPLIAAAVFNGVVSLCSNLELSFGMLKSLIACFSLGMLIEITVGILTTILTSLGNDIDNTSLSILGSVVNQEETFSQKIILKSGADFFHMIVPQNPFSAFADGNGLKVLFFSIIMGISFSFGNKEKVKIITDFLAEVFDACIRVLNFLTVLLPFGLFFIFAKQSSIMTVDMVKALSKLMFVAIGITIIMTLANLIYIKILSRKSFIATCRDMIGILVMAFGTASGFVTMPRIISDLHKNFKIDNGLLKLMIPLAVNMSPQGTSLSISIFAIFFCQMYHIPIDGSVIMITAIGTWMISLAISGLPAIVGISLIATMLELLGVPSGIATVVLMAVFPVVDPFLTMLNCVGSSAYALFLSQQTVKQEVLDPIVAA